MLSILTYTDLTGTKSEPLELVRAYLAKFPSTITLTDTELDRKPTMKNGSKDEMERRLWLCDKWFYELQLQKAEQKTVINEDSKAYGGIFKLQREVLWDKGIG